MGKSFQFTPLREGRPDARLRRTYTLQDFNSRPSARGDMLSAFLLIHSLISIHAPPRGATHFFAIFWRKNIFQFTPLREGRLPGLKRGDPVGRYFNSRPSARGDEKPQKTRKRHAHFNSRPSARGDRDARGQRHVRRYFNSRPSARGDAYARAIIRRMVRISIHAPPRGATVLPVRKNC